MDEDLRNKAMSFVEDMRKHLVEMHRLSAAGHQRAGTVTQSLLPAAMEQAGAWEQVTEDGVKMAYEFAKHGMDLGAAFASRGMELGYEFASKGEEVGPMAYRILFMAVQIGVMADRIGEMADRILFMADKIGEFGDKIVYVSQLIIYTEQMIINESVLITRAISLISEAILTLLALADGNGEFIAGRTEHLKADRSLDLIYENMNLMLRNMHDYSLRMIDKEAADRQSELKVREMQGQLREATMGANSCYCPGFGVATPPPGASGSEEKK